MTNRAKSTPALPRDDTGTERRSGRIAEADLADHEAMLLDAARALFYEYGFDGTSIDAVARVAHVSPKTIYGRFGGKSGLFFEAMRARADRILSPLNAPVAGADDVRDALVGFATRLLGVTTQKEALLIARTITAEAVRFPELAASFYAAGPARGSATVALFLGRADAAGLLCVDEPTVAAEFFVGALLGVPLREALLVHKRPSPATIAKRARDIVTVFLRAYARPSA